MSTDQAIQAQAAHEPALLAKPNVVGVAVGYKESNGVNTGDIAVVVLVEQKKPLAALSAEDVIPREVQGMRTDVVEVGYLRAQQTARERYRPVIPSGVSMGHFKVTAGTLGTVVRDRTTGEMLLLSNNHVFANSNDAALGDAILQPGTTDGGQNPGDVVAQLARYAPLRFVEDAPVQQPPIQQPTRPPQQPPAGGAPGCNVVVSVGAQVINAVAALVGSTQRVVTAQAQTEGNWPSMVPEPPNFSAQAVPENVLDAALARPLNPAMFSDDIRTIGVVNATRPPQLGMRVRKYGRTTEYTEGTVNLVNATVNIAYSTAKGTRTARFVGQIITNSMSQGGDSGSLVVDASDNTAVGLLFAGSELATIFTPIDVVLNTLSVTI